MFPEHKTNKMTIEGSMILDLWTEFAMTDDEEKTGIKYWHGYIGALQAAEGYLRKHKLIATNGDRFWDFDKRFDGFLV